MTPDRTSPFGPVGPRSAASRPRTAERCAGNDQIDGGGGDDTLFGDNSNFDGDATAGTAGGRDRLRGQAGDDSIFAGPAGDFLDGGADTDFCDGEAGTADAAVNCETTAGIP
ncbi:hypothetical protein [Streptomyces sp. NBC_00161]|uniref:hypothetical protein n=1 Tax=Streptomyces sp. NBC_00161 TaxID=2975671 RepID=UPI00386F09FE